MFKKLSLLLMLVGLSFLLVDSAEAASHRLTVVNRTAVTICALYVSPVEQTTWGYNQLDDTVLEPGDSVRLSYPEGNYDLLAETCDETMVDEQWDVPLTSDTRWTLGGTHHPQARTDRDRDGVPDSDDACLAEAETYNGIFDYDGCPDDITTLMDWSASAIDQFWADNWESVQIISGSDVLYESPTAVNVYYSASDYADDYNAYYSRAEHAIYYDYYLLNDAVAEFGDAAAVMVMAHEFGHLVHNLLGINQWVDHVTLELNADCLSGGYFAELESLGWLDPGDLEEATAFVYTLATDEPGTHGTRDQRLAAFLYGYDNGFIACMEG